MTRRHFFSCVITALFVYFFSVNNTEAKEVPEALNKCLDTAIQEMLLVDRDDQKAVKALFLKHIDANRLGANAVGGKVWKDADQQWKRLTIDMYFNLLYSKGSKLTVGMRDA